MVSPDGKYIERQRFHGKEDNSDNDDDDESLFSGALLTEKGKKGAQSGQNMLYLVIQAFQLNAMRFWPGSMILTVNC